MSKSKFGSAGVTTREIDLTAPTSATPTGTPAGVVGTALKGPAFVPTTVGLLNEFYSKFGLTDGKKFGPLAVAEWMRNAQAVTYLRVLGAGDGTKRISTGNLAGSVNNAGFVVGQTLPDPASGINVPNPYANSGGPLGRTFFLGCFMSESNGSTVFSSAGLQGTGSFALTTTGSIPVIRGVLMAPSGVIPTLSGAFAGVNDAPASTYIANPATVSGSMVGSVILLDGTQAKQQFTVLLNGHAGLDPTYPNVITASFDQTSPNYFANVFNRDPYKLQQAGHYLYASWDVHPAVAAVTGTGLVSSSLGAGGSASRRVGTEAAAFLVSGSQGRNVGATNVPNFENFQDRFGHAKSPWIISQKFGGSPTNLFRLHALDDGAGQSTNVKVSIENIAPSNDPVTLYGTFDVVVRDWQDSDLVPRVLEAFRGVTLNPSSNRYIAKVIGDQNTYFDFDKVAGAQKIVIDGNYENASNFVRVEMDTGVEDGTTDPTALPLGFRGPAHLVTSGTQPLTHMNPTTELTLDNVLKCATEIPVPYRQVVTNGAPGRQQVDTRYYWGTQFGQVNNLNDPNATSYPNTSLKSFALYFPNFMTTVQNVVEEDSFGLAATDATGILDADRFNWNRFSLENVQVVTGSDTNADPTAWSQAVYVRNGNITSNDTNKTRAFVAGDLNVVANRRFGKFTTFLQGGFDGTLLFDRNETEINDVAVKGNMDDATRGLTAGPAVSAYTKAIDVMKNKSDVDVQLLAIPGIRQSVVTDYATTAVEGRFDALYLMDIVEYDTLNSVVTGSSQTPSVTNTVTNFKNRSLNSSFAAAYYPDVEIVDPNTDSIVTAPPSVAVLGAFALNDRVGFPWFAPAGFTRGALPSVTEAKVKLSKDNLDNLYDAYVNPLVAFPGDTPPGTQAQGGVVVWGQKTLYQLQSALDRVNVRRLLIEIRRRTRAVGNTILFEPNREVTLAKFSSAVNPILEKIRKQFGLQQYKVVIDTSTTTQADIDNLTVRGKIFLQPTRTIEYVSIDFVLTNRAQGQ